MNRGRPGGTYDGETVGGIGYMLGEARAQRGLTLRQVAKAIGVSQSFVSNIEHGRAPLPAKYVLAISRLLNLDHSTVASFSIQRTRSFQNYKKVAL
jgi:transcriptional regulator with XRE-family HTH domain